MDAKQLPLYLASGGLLAALIFREFARRMIKSGPVSVLGSILYVPAIIACIVKLSMLVGWWAAGIFLAAWVMAWLMYKHVPTLADVRELIHYDPERIEAMKFIQPQVAVLFVGLTIASWWVG